MKKGQLIIGSRGSPLALWQTDWVKEQLSRLYPELTVTVQVIQTSGDKMLEASLATMGGKGLFLKEIEEALLAGTVDCAVHSMKDVPVDLPAGLTIVAMTEREDPRDVLISSVAPSIESLPLGTKIGTSALRRQTQLKHQRPDLELLPLRGNVGTRLDKIKRGTVDGILLAAAGVKRLGFEGQVTQWIDVDTILPAVGQGCIGVETREDDSGLNEILSTLDHGPTRLCVHAERMLLKGLAAGCQAPIGVYGVIESDALILKARVLSLDGQTCLAEQVQGPLEQSLTLAQTLGLRLKDQGAIQILKEVEAALQS